MMIFLSYLVAFFMIILVTVIAPFMLVIFKPIVSRIQWVAPVVQFIITGLGSFLAIFAYYKLSQNSSLSLSYLIILLPIFMIYMNHIKRVHLAKSGNSVVKRMMEAAGDQYNQKLDVRSEQGAEYGHLVGSLGGMAVCLAGAPFFF